MSRPSWLNAPLRLGDAIVRPGARTDRRVERAHDASINPLHELGRALTAALLPPLGVALAVLAVTGAYGSFADAVVAGGFAGWLAALVLRLVGSPRRVRGSPSLSSRSPPRRRGS